MYNLFRPFLFRLDPEDAHNLTLRTALVGHSLASQLVTDRFRFEHPALRQEVLGFTFENPVGLAAGMDKNARLPAFWRALGFGFAEVGSVSARPSRGNPRPRLFRLPDDEALVNRMGLNNQGAARIARRLESAGSPGFPLGINLAKTHDPAIMGEAAVDDFRESFRLLAPHASYVALNISCPNTTEGKTFEEPLVLDALLSAINDERWAIDSNVPVFLKLSPPISDSFVFDSAYEETLAIARTYGVAGFIATNTAPDRDHLRTAPETIQRIGNGGLSGRPLESRALHLVRYLYSATEGLVPIIGVGGIRSAETAYARIKAGATLVQLYTALVYEGPALVRRINEGLVRLLEHDGLAEISEARGSGA
jgi:dihydroorotate dehydrogenase